MAPPPPSRLLLVVLVVVVLAAAGGLAGYVYYRDRPASPPSVLMVETGDNVTVNYIGIFGSGPEQGKVFDTSLYSVATNDAQYPKGLEYSPRGAAANYTPLPVHVGGSTPSGGYTVGGLSYISVVTGFWQGLLGLAGNQTRSVSVPPALGYGFDNPSCIVTYPLVQHLPVVQTYTRSQFTAAYPSVTAATGATFNEPHFLWPVLIVSVNATSVVTENLAQVGDTASPSGWTVEVTNVSSTANGTGDITLVNELTPADAGVTLGKDFTGTGSCAQSSGGKFIVTAVNLTSGTYTANFNTEVTGQTLIFIVTIVSIHTPAASAAAVANPPPKKA
jgi:FKBP-type peptidyl-prolyl cis-trans isomerase 2